MTALSKHSDLAITPWKQRRQRKYCLQSVNLIDTVDGTVKENVTLRLADGIVRAVGETNTQIDEDEQVIDLKGKFICPGLIDCHAHITAVPGETSLAGTLNMSHDVSLLRQPWLCRAILERGFTTVRDCAGAGLALKQAIADGVVIGPRLFIAGKALSQTGGHGDLREQTDQSECCGGKNMIGRVVDGVEECLKYARDNIRQGSDFLKIMGGGGVASPADKIEHLQFSEDEIRAIVTVAENAGTYVTSHSYTPKAIQQAVRLGVKGIEHGNLLDEETAKMMAENEVFLTPTLVTYKAMADANFLPPASKVKNEMVLDKGIEAIRIAKKASVTICFGTDLLGPLHSSQSLGFQLQSEALNAVENLQTATVNAARLLRQEKFLGQLALGFAADAIILDKNPFEDITILADPGSILAVIKDGRVVSSTLSSLQREVD